eukprot:TRINITY_DN4928_c0_g1_i1.p1 TRINITY_DN4928_c0_g1~~TRINITY_DN4928_c0_g1_i1.p1  ORF type:complete len:132 (+),score=16.20 TRINITY_DN4928_c0_g1_i1:63-458(+)
MVTGVATDAEKKAEDYKVSGNELMGLHKYDDAIVSYTKAIELNPQNEKYYSNRALAYIRTSEFKRAVADAQKAISIKPDYVNAICHLAEAEKGHHKYRRAAEAFERALKLAKTSEKRAKLYKNRQRGVAKS